MEEGVLQRVISICRQKSVSESQFAKMIGSNQKTINQQLRGERSISLDTISIMQIFGINYESNI